MTTQELALKKPPSPFDNLKIQLRDNKGIRRRFEDILADNAPAFMASIVSVVSDSKYLQDCSLPSILSSAVKAAILDLPIEPALGLAYIVPYKKIATFQIGYKGLINLCMRTNMYLVINAGPAFQGQTVDVNQMTSAVMITGAPTSEEAIGFFAYFKLLNGLEHSEYMTVDQIHIHAKRYAPSYSYSNSAWQTNFNDMARKTVLKRLINRWGPKSIKVMGTNKNLVDLAKDEQDLGIEIPSFDDVVDGELADPPPASPAQPPAQETGPPTQQDPNGQKGAATAAQAIPASWHEAIIKAGLAENEFAVRGALAKVTAWPKNAAAAMTWMRLYRGWRDVGVDSDPAAAKANAGEIPAVQTAFE
jgi:recombination protein RecT